MSAPGRSYNRYQYETSPRKLQPKEEPQRIPNKPKRSSTASKKNIQADTSKQTKLARQSKIKAVFYLVVGFALLYAVGFRNSQINEAFAKKQSVDRQISQVKKENEQLEVSIQNSLNLSQIEALAKERLGMQKLTSQQTTYIDLPKKDYIEPGSEEVKIEENEGFFDGIINFIKNIFN